MRKKPSVQRTALVLAAGMLLATPAWAAGEPSYELDQVTVTATRIPQKVADVPGDVTVVTAEQIHDKGARNLADALDGVAGVFVRRSGGPGELVQPYILGSERVVVLVDGRRLNLPQGTGYGEGGIDLSRFLITDNIDRIEVVRGGSSVLYGADAVGGVINIITRQGNGKEQSTVTVGGGNYGGRQYEFNTRGGDNGWHWNISGAKELFDGQRTNSAFQGKTGAIRLDRDLNQQEKLTFDYDYFGSHAGIPGSMDFPTTTDYGDVSRHNWGIGYTRQHDDSQASWRYYDNRQIYSGENNGSFRHENTVRGAEYQDSAKISSRQLLTWGSEWRKDSVISTGEGGVRRDSIVQALFVQDQYRWGERTVLTTGMRYDHNSLYGTNVLPQAGITYQADKKTSYFANWSRVFKAPAFDDLYGDDGYGDTGNPNLKPEKGWTAETGVKKRLNDSQEITVALFERQLSDAIKWQMDSNYTFHPQNIAGYRASGVDATLSTRLSPCVQADAGYTYLDSRDQNDAAVGDPRHTFHVGLKVASGKLTTNLLGSYTAPNGSVYSRIAGRFTLDTAFQYRLNPKQTLYLTVNNAFNKKYLTASGYPGQERTYLLGIKLSL